MSIEEKRLELFDFKLSIIMEEKNIFVDTASVIARREVDAMSDGEIEDLYGDVIDDGDLI